jgi:nicotinamide-nucleotide amidase
VTDDDLAPTVIDLLTIQSMTVAVAESLTGGLVLARLTSVPGASAVVKGGVVSYSASVKEEVLGVDGVLLRERGPVNKQVAEEMAEHVAALCGSDIGLATTGVAGPGDQDGIAAGTYWVALNSEGNQEAQKHRVSGDRRSVRSAAVVSVLHLLMDMLDSDHGYSA